MNKLLGSTCIFIIFMTGIATAEDNQLITPFEEKISNSTLYQSRIQKWSVAFHKDLAIQETVGPFDFIDENNLIFVSRCGKVNILKIDNSNLKVISNQKLPVPNNQLFCGTKDSPLLEKQLAGVKGIVFDSFNNILYVLHTVSEFGDKLCVPTSGLLSYFSKNKCIGIKVEAYKLDSNLQLHFSHVVYQSTLRSIKKTAFTQEGGGMTMDSLGNLIFAIGDFGYLEEGFDISNNKNSFGKVFIYSPITKNTNILAKGIRNTAGLYFDKTTKIIYGVDHGPKGGDEINVIRQGDNLGWPLSTYGTGYESQACADYFHGCSHSAGKKPLFAYLPDIGINSVLVIPQSSSFLNWKGDLIVGALSQPNIMRLRLADGVVKYSESIPVYTNRLRYLKLSPSGKLYGLADEGTLIAISPSN